MKGKFTLGVVLILFAVILLFTGCSNNNEVSRSSLGVVSSQAKEDITLRDDTNTEKTNEKENSNLQDTIYSNVEPKIQTSEGEYVDLSKSEQYAEIKKAIDNNTEFIIWFSTEKPEIGKIKYDFNNDGNLETLEYSTIVEKNEYGIETVGKCNISIGELSVEHEYSGGYEIAGGISYLAIVDVDKNDSYIEFYISEGELADRVVNVFYRLAEKGIEEISTLRSAITAFSGDGKIYFWDGCLFEQYINDVFNDDVVLIYYDFNKKQYIQTDQIIGKTIIADQQIFLYETNEDVACGPPVTDDDILTQKGDKIIKTIKPDERFTVIEIEYNSAFYSNPMDDGKEEICFSDNGIKIRTEDGKEGWIGGFHMVWD